MKQAKNFTIDEDLIKKLEKEENASKLVNDLLWRHYNSNVKSEEIRIRIKEKEKMLNEINQELANLKNQLRAIEENESKRKAQTASILEKLPQEIIDELKNHGPKLNEYSLRSQYDYVYSKKYPNLKWEELKEAYEEFKKINGVATVSNNENGAD